MNRRNFLRKSVVLMTGCLLEMNGLSKAFAFERIEEKYFSKPLIALIIDDIGNSRSRARQFLELNVPITFSILPRLRYSYSLAIELYNEGHELMLHQPMEPYNSYLDPGPGALYVGDESKTISSTIEDNISYVPFAIGVNNHMGSRFTECEDEITETLKVIKKQNLFFVDSRTSNHSKAHRTARRLNMATARRNVFLDNSRNESAILYELHKLTQCARKYGHAVGIGHPFRATARAIGDFIKNYKDPDVSLVHISEILYTGQG